MNQVWIYVKKMPADTEKRQFSRMGRELLSRGLRERWGIHPAQYTIEIGAHGKPYIKERNDVFFNISHSGSYVVCALAEEPVGIDIEFHRKASLERISSRFFSETEKKRFAQAEDQMQAFYDIWTESESFGKWKGTGIAETIGQEKEEGVGVHFFLEEGYSASLWTEHPAQIRLIRV